MIKMKLKDGTEVEFTGMNGENFIAPEEMDTDIFTNDNLEEGSIEAEDGSIEFKNWSFIQQQKQQNGDYYICFYERPEQEIEIEALKKSLVSIAEAEINLGNITADDLDGAIRDTVKADIEGGLVKDFP